MTVTIFNFLEEIDGVGCYQPTVIEHVYMECKTAENPVNDGARRFDNFQLYIFDRRGYLPPEEWKLSPSGHWTLAPGDYVVKGKAEELSRRPLRINTITELTGPEEFHHWEVRGRGTIVES